MADLSPEREAELERRRDQARNLWRISADCGNPPSEARKAYDMTLIEMKFSCGNLDRCLTVAGYTSDWLKTGNPFYIDGAVYLCELEGIAPPPTLAKEVAAVAKQRFFGDTKGGTAHQIQKDNAKGFALSRMAKLCAAGATQKVAASKVARMMADIGGGLGFKASTLEAYYTEDWQRIARRMERAFTDDPEHLAHWKLALEQMPEADDELKGNRRD